MALKSISETKRVRYLLGLSFPAERESIESEYFDNDDAFQQMLTAEDDLIDAYARGELVGEERRRFEKNFVSSLRGRDRVQFARALAGTVSATRPVETKLPGTLLNIIKSFQSPGLLRTATITAVLLLVAVLAWLVIDRRRMTNEFHELRAESAELSKRTRNAETAAQLADLRAYPDVPRPQERATGATQRARHSPEIKNWNYIKPEATEKLINTQEAPLHNAFETTITKTPILGRKYEDLLTLEPDATFGGYLVRTPSDQADMIPGAVEDPQNGSALPQNTISSGTTRIRGTAKDPQGNLVSGATVTLTDPTRNFTRTQHTDKNGTYVFNAIPPGTYSIEITARGFKTALASGLAALIDNPTVIDIQLEVGAVSETVDVTSATQASINTSDVTIGNSFERKRITELPLNANNVVGLLSLQPDVTREGSVNGARADQSNITLDGVDINTLNTYSLTPRNTNSGNETIIQSPGFLSWIRFELALETVAIHEHYRLTIKTADSHPVTSVDWIEPLTPNQTIIDTPAISTGDLPSGDYVLLLMGKEPSGSFIKVAEYTFKVIKY